MSDNRDNFGRKIQSVFLFFLLFGMAAYFFVYVTEKVSEPSKITIAQKPAEKPDEMTDPSTGGEIVYKLIDNGSVDVSERAAGEKPAGEEKKISAPLPFEEPEEKPAPPPVGKREPEKPKPAPVAEKKPAPAPKPVERKPEPPKPAVKPAEKKPEPKPVVKETPKPAVKGAYVLQLAAYKEEATAKAELNKLKKSFPDIYYVKIDLGAKGVWYRLRCSPSATYGEAQKKRDAVKAKYRLEPIIVKSDL
ncbi:SPOR domain-containing protein [Geovibrio thiophilus]|uniref:SPOR domain-containing protein n=1 Tax=Geovibrio thiophilus TaxID=139438 RepID=A0A3R5X2G8_9BACT|nr:SPOR domain-containing protein [Geovibrio thiophilus]QAR32916.1 SPOR domain-containing protein [Geovibrio thiophilus]